jgi:hypothetical protein
MSFDYRGCFILDKTPIDPVLLDRTLTSFGLAFGGSFSSLTYEAGRTRQEDAAERDWAAFIADGNGAAPSAFGQLVAEEFRFDFGFVTLPSFLDGRERLEGMVRAAWLEISDQKLYDMALSFDDQDSNPVKLLAGLYTALNARSMAFGMETTAIQFLRFFSGQLPLAEVEANISTAICPTAESGTAMRQSPWLREIDVNGVLVLTRYLSGLDEYFPKRNS